MSGWAIVAIVAIVVWGIVKLVRRPGEQTRDREGEPAQRLDAEARAEIARLQERIAVLERIATDRHSPEAREARAISSEIEALRDRTAD